MLQRLRAIRLLAVPLPASVSGNVVPAGACSATMSAAAGPSPNDPGGLLSTLPALRIRLTGPEDVSLPGAPEQLTSQISAVRGQASASSRTRHRTALSPPRFLIGRLNEVSGTSPASGVASLAVSPTMSGRPKPALAGRLTSLASSALFRAGNTRSRWFALNARSAPTVVSQRHGQCSGCETETILLSTSTIAPPRRARSCLVWAPVVGSPTSNDALLKAPEHRSGPTNPSIFGTLPGAKRATLDASYSAACIRAEEVRACTMNLPQRIWHTTVAGHGAQPSPSSGRTRVPHECPTQPTPPCWPDLMKSGAIAGPRYGTTVMFSTQPGDPRRARPHEMPQRARGPLVEASSIDASRTRSLPIGGTPPPLLSTPSRCHNACCTVMGRKPCRHTSLALDSLLSRRFPSKPYTKDAISWPPTNVARERLIIA